MWLKVKTTSHFLFPRGKGGEMPQHTKSVSKKKWPDVCDRSSSLSQCEEGRTEHPPAHFLAHPMRVTCPIVLS